jgi:hypothetical protein
MKIKIEAKNDHPYTRYCILLLNPILASRRLYHYGFGLVDGIYLKSECECFQGNDLMENGTL